MICWSVLKTRPQCEPSLDKKIVAAGFKTCLPKCKVQILHARKKEIVERALFPTHLFVGLDLESDHWRDLERLPGSVGFIRFGPRPSQLRLGALEAIMQAVQAGAFDFDTLAAGHTVTVVDGPFAGFVGRIASLDKKNRQRAILELMDTVGRGGGMASVSVSVDNLRRLV